MDYLAINKKLWNDKTEAHYKSDFYDVNSFIEGKDSLNPIEIRLLGNIKGKKILHLQCHFGMDTISLSRRGATVTGIDLSDKSIARALELKEMTGSNVRFIESDVYNLHEKLDEKFDMVYTSYGVVGWLPDMDKWAQTIGSYLLPGGKFVMVEFHPVVWMFDDDFEKIDYNYVDPEPIIEEYEGTYADRNAKIKSKAVSWNHGLASVLNSLIRNGMVITSFLEYDYSPYDCFKNTVKIAEGKFQIKGLENKIPMLYSVTAIKK